MTVTPTCSVVVAARNEEKHLHAALRSILDQQGVNLELVFVDDHSTDLTSEIAQKLAQEDPRLSVHQNPRKGKCSAFNYGVSQANGDYVCIFAGDDVMPECSLALRLDAIKSLGNDSPVVGLSKLITESDDPKYDQVVVPKRPGVGALSGVSPLMNKSALAIVFPVPESLPNEDTWMELAALHIKQLTLVHSDVIACKWRRHQGNTSANMTEAFPTYSRKIADRKRALPLFLDHFRHLLDETEVRSIEAKIHCEEMRQQGRVVGVLKSEVDLVDRLRALSSTNSFFYRLRRTFYSALSGW